MEFSDRLYWGVEWNQSKIKLSRVRKKDNNLEFNVEMEKYDDIENEYDKNQYKKMNFDLHKYDFREYDEINYEELNCGQNGNVEYTQIFK